MKTPIGLSAAALLLLQVQCSLGETISQINGNRFISSYKGKSVTNVEGLVTAKGSSGFYMRSITPDGDPATSESIYVYGSSVVSQVSVGDIITLNGKVSEYRSSGSSYVYLTELTSPSNIVVTSSGNAVTPVVIGENGLIPPTKQFTSLDEGDVFGLPNNASQLSVENPVLQPSKYGMDFWESLSGELATIKSPRAIAKPNRYGDTFVVGNWATTGENERGGLTMTSGDANPEAIVIGSPLDGSSNPTDTKLGDEIADITGILTYAYGYYALLPLTALTVEGSNATQAAATTLTADGTCRAITVGDYNVNNLSPTSATLPKIANHIANFLKSPTVMFLQEIQDSSGPTNDGVVSANETLSALADEIRAQGGIAYDFVDVDPLDGEDGGQPGGNIRVAYLYDPSVVRLRNVNPGSSSQAVDVVDGELTYNPGLIAPTDAAWESSRKPLVAAWETLDGRNKFFTVNVHFTSKGGGSSIAGDARPPVNGGVDQRTEQAKLVAEFTSTLLSQDPNARIIAAGDFNEFSFVDPLLTLTALSGLTEIDDLVGLPPTERYTYLYDMNCQQLDHMFVSEELRGALFEHVHVNTWVAYGEQASDHDPSVGVFDVCE